MERGMREMRGMDVAKQLYQMVTHLKECMKMERDMVMVYTGQFINSRSEITTGRGRGAPRFCQSFEGWDQPNFGKY